MIPREQEYGRDAAAIFHKLRKASGASQWDVVSGVKKVSAQASISQPKLSLFEAGRRSFSSDDLDIVGEVVEDFIIENWDAIKERAEVINALTDWLRFQVNRYLAPPAKITTKRPPLSIEQQQKSSRVRLFGAHAADPLRVTKLDIARQIRSVRMALLGTRIEETETKLASLKQQLSSLTKQDARDSAEIESSFNTNKYSD